MEEKEDTKPINDETKDEKSDEKPPTTTTTTSAAPSSVPVKPTKALNKSKQIAKTRFTCENMIYGEANTLCCPMYFFFCNSYNFLKF